MSNETMTAALVPAMASQETQQPAGMTYVSDIIGEAYKGWENGRVIFDCGTGRGKNEFIIRKLADYAIDRMSEGDTNHKILYLCPLNALHADMMNRRREAVVATFGEEMADEWDVYEDVLEIQTYQHIETLRRNNPAALEKYMAQFKVIVADECHYFTDFSSYNINTCLSLEVLQSAEADHVVIQDIFFTCVRRNLFEYKFIFSHKSTSYAGMEGQSSHGSFFFFGIGMLYFLAFSSKALCRSAC